MNNNVWLIGTTLPDGTRAYWDYTGQFTPMNIGFVLETLVEARRKFGEVQAANPETKIELYEYKLISTLNESDLPTAPITE